MIVYRAETRPEWLEDASNLCEQHGAACRYYGIGSPIYFAPPADGWVEVDDGVAAAVVGDAFSDPIVRDIPGMRFDTVTVGRTAIAVPIILTADGTRAFVAPIGEDYLPALTAEQERIVDIAEAAREELQRCADGDDGIDAQAASRWACELIVFANHISEKTLLRMGLLDEGIVVETLIKATCCG